MPLDADDPEFLATYGRWSLGTFLGSLDSEPAVLALVTVETDETTDDARELTNDMVHRVWDATVAAFPRCAGHRLLWSWLLFLFDARDAERARELLANTPARSSSHTVQYWFAETGNGTAERKIAIRDLEDRRERDRARAQG